MSDSVDRRLKKIESRLERMEKSQKNAQESTAKEMKEVKSMCERILQLVSHIPVLLYNRVKQALPLTNSHFFESYILIIIALNSWFRTRLIFQRKTVRGLVCLQLATQSCMVLLFLHFNRLFQNIIVNKISRFLKWNLFFNDRELSVVIRCLCRRLVGAAK